jgi:hypothetical protein
MLTNRQIADADDEITEQIEALTAARKDRVPRGRGRMLSVCLYESVKPHSSLSLPQQTALVAKIMRQVDECLGVDQRTTERAFRLARLALGFSGPVDTAFFYQAGRLGAEAAVRMYPNVVGACGGSGIIYFFLDEAKGLVKIGYTCDLSRRQRQIQDACRSNLRLIYRCSGYRLTELLFHVRARSAARHGEWFSYEELVRIPSFSFLRGDRA